MCTLIVIKGLYPTFPLVIAGNRDELLDRPSEIPQLRENGIYAPKDLQRHGSWTGINDSGIFVGLTNRNDVKSKPGRVSRGQLVMELLACKTITEVENYILGLYGANYNGFNLLVASPQFMYMVRGDGVDINSHAVNGLVAITNHGVFYDDDGQDPVRPRRLKNILKTWQDTTLLHTVPDRTALQKLLDIHDEERHGTCLNEPHKNYGTKSSHIVRLHQPQDPKKWAFWEYWHRERTGSTHICHDEFDICRQVVLTSAQK